MPYETEEETYVSPLREMGLINAEEKTSLCDSRGFFRPEVNDHLYESAAREKGAICEGEKWKFSRSLNLPQHHLIPIDLMNKINRKFNNE